VNNEAIAWDGAFQEPGTCANSLACHTLRYAPAGRYVASMCATPGRIITGVADETGNDQTCEPAGEIECVQLQFDFPSSQPVVGVLPEWNAADATAPVASGDSN
jgi:hypothetical protein